MVKKLEENIVTQEAKCKSVYRKSYRTETQVLIKINPNGIINCEYLIGINCGNTSRNLNHRCQYMQYGNKI